MTRTAPILAGILLTATAACAVPRATARDVKASDAVAATAAPEVEGSSEPLIIDWRPEWRTALEEAMHDALAVVRYSGTSLKFVPGCSLPGSYAFLPTTRQEKLVVLESGDEVAATLPTTGLQIVGSIGGRLQQGEALHLAFVLVGKRRSTRVRVARDELVGPDDACGQATHFVRGASIGAFATQLAAKRSIASAAQVFGVGISAKTASAESRHDVVGDLDACTKMGKDDLDPPAQCTAPIYIELSPILAKGAPAAASETIQHCPRGFTYEHGKCVRGDGDACADTATCQKRCNADDADACGRAGRLIFDARRDDVSWRPAAEPWFERACTLGALRYCKDAAAAMRPASGGPLPEKAQTLLERACDAGDPYACDLLGLSFLATRPELGAKLFERACRSGDAIGCDNLAKAYRLGRGVPVDLARAYQLNRAGCEGGEPEGCHDAAVALSQGSGTTADPKKARHELSLLCMDGTWIPSCHAAAALDLKLGTPDVAATHYSKACTAHDDQACIEMAALIADGEVKTAMAPTRALELLGGLCDGGRGYACRRMGLAYVMGKTVPKDRARGIALYAKACEAASPDGPACYLAAGALGRGDEIQKDLARARRAADRGCSIGFGLACMWLAYSQEHGTTGAVDPSAAFATYTRACELGEANACTEVARFYEEGRVVSGDVPRAAKLYTSACKNGEALACAYLGRLHERGAYVKKSAVQAKTYYRKACDGGATFGCSLLRGLTRGDRRDGRTLEQLGDACDRAEGGACAKLGERFLYGDGVVEDHRHARSLLQRGCEGKNGESCELLAEAMKADGEGLPLVRATQESACIHGSGRACALVGDALLKGDGVASDIARAFAQYGRACDLGYGHGCTEQGWMLAKGNGVAKDEARALSLFRKACDHGSGSGCVRLALAHHYGDFGAPKDLHRAATYARRACDLESQTGCSVLADSAAHGQGMKQDLVLAANMYEHACSLGDQHSCVEHARMLTEGYAGHRDVERGTTMLEHLCRDKKDGDACRDLAIYQWKDETGPKDVRLAAETLRQGCNDGDKSSCASLGYLYVMGRGVSRDPERGIRMMKEACDANEPQGCNNLGWSYFMGWSVPRNPSRAVGYFEKLCADSDRNCSALGYAYALGAGVPRDQGKAVALFKRSCDAASDSGCIALGFMYYTGKGVSRDEKRAAALMKDRSESVAFRMDDCEDGFERACSEVGVALRLKGQLAEGDNYIRRSCDLKDLWACDELTRRR